MCSECCATNLAVLNVDDIPNYNICVQVISQYIVRQEIIIMETIN